MNIKKYLSQVHVLDKEIKHELEIIKELNNPSKYGKTEKTEKALNLEKQILDKIENMRQLKEKICNDITRIEDITEKELLQKRYIQNLTWEDIAEQLGYSITQTYRIHKKALSNFKV
ncbi:sigma factor-like helix-turn-helix DNA-binding protein [Fusobacterium sp.]|uniref:sigma factor-like helix-turn-helix DNA-binding protein n=1 Tax=Fusobacterium sp. TaxID=68766 RepID=UPI0029026880|nr:sigma factor-like helix-turn-helix DNA-binding protein [Fusobacterium sp.]MDU1909721.1 sigma factor-like helix-turn-helix DNA-binding protein [Fusobacterium sp.]